MLNRSAVVVRPRQPFLDWIRSVEELDEPDMTLATLFWSATNVEPSAKVTRSSMGLDGRPMPMLSAPCRGCVLKFFAMSPYRQGSADGFSPFPDDQISCRDLQEGLAQGASGRLWALLRASIPTEPA